MGKDVDTGASDRVLAQAEGVTGALSDQGAFLTRRANPLIRQMSRRGTDQLKSGFFDANLDLDELAGTPEFNAIKTATERQFDNARRRSIEQVAPGGQLTGALSGIEAARAGTLASGLGGLASQEAGRRERGLARLQQLSTGLSGQGLQATGLAAGNLGSLGANQAEIALAQSNQNAGKATGLGTAVGMGLGGFFGGPAGASLGAKAGGAAGGATGPGGPGFRGPF